MQVLLFSICSKSSNNIWNEMPWISGEDSSIWISIWLHRSGDTMMSNFRYFSGYIARPDFCQKGWRRNENLVLSPPGNKVIFSPRRGFGIFPTFRILSLGFLFLSSGRASDRKVIPRAKIPNVVQNGLLYYFC
jgi:hypothetical protein